MTLTSPRSAGLSALPTTLLGTPISRVFAGESSREIVRLVLLSLPICVAFRLGADVYDGILVLSISGAAAYSLSALLAWYGVRQAVAGKARIARERKPGLGEDDGAAT